MFVRDGETAEDFRQEGQAGNFGSSKPFDTVCQRQECKHLQIVKLSHLECLGILRKADTSVELNSQSSWHSLE